MNRKTKGTPFSRYSYARGYSAQVNTQCNTQRRFIQIIIRLGANDAISQIKGNSKQTSEDEKFDMPRENTEK